ncbi:hypothetical protein, partial [Xanthomonas oryzae]|uniref:hypothetical protein n=1 Tax=Xanthomonas oryzae TaxID=347 RepID=UPI001CA599E9
CVMSPCSPLKVRANQVTDCPAGIHLAAPAGSVAAPAGMVTAIATAMTVAHQPHRVVIAMSRSASKLPA